MSKFNQYLEATKYQRGPLGGRMYDFPYHVNPECRKCKHLERMTEEDNSLNYYLQHMTKQREEAKAHPLLGVKKKWVVIDLKDVDKKILELLWDMYQKTYGSQTGEKGLSLDNYKSIYELKEKYKLCWLVDVDADPEPDAFIIYKDTANDNKKISLIGSDRSAVGKRALLDKLYELLKTKGWYLEASVKLEEICRTKGFNYVDNEEHVKSLIGHKAKGMKWLGDGYYMRDLTNSNIQIKKRIYGLPN